jgi:hypothetical protein
LQLGRARRFKHAHGALDIGVHIFGRALDRRDDVADTREMKHVSGVGKHRRVRRKHANIEPLERQRGIASVMPQIAFPPADQIVHDPHTKALRQQAINHMAADKPGAAGDDGNRLARAHVAPIRFIVRTL